MQQIYQNPAGKGSAQISSRYTVKADLKKRYDKLKEDGKEFELNVYGDEKTFVLVFKVPSEQKDEKDLRYDVVLELIRGISGSSISLLRYYLRFWSNSPAFKFTYAHAAYKNGWIPKWLVSKTSRKSRVTAAKVRNPTDRMGFEKSIYFAILYLEENELFKVQYLTKLSKGLINKKFLESLVAGMDEKEKEYNINKIEKSLNKKIEKEKDLEIPTDEKVKTKVKRNFLGKKIQKVKSSIKSKKIKKV